MRKILATLAISSLFFFTSCLKKMEQPLPTICITEPETARSLAQYDSSNYGFYKGVFVGETSGVIVVNINNDNTVFARSASGEIYSLHVYNYATTQTIQEGTATMIHFSTGNSSFTFSVERNGANPVITNFVVNAQPGAEAIVAKETSTAIVKCFEGTYTGEKEGILNAIIYNGQIKALMQNTLSRAQFISNGTVLNNQIITKENINTDLILEGTLSEMGNKLSGSWNHSTNYFSGKWTGKRIF